MKLRLPKIGEIKVCWSRELPAEPSSVTVVLDAAGRYFASFVMETEDEPGPVTTNEVGIDLGLTTFAVLSNGTIIDNPRILRRAERKLAKLQKQLSRKQKGSKNRAKARFKVAKQHAKVKDARQDFHHNGSGLASRAIQRTIEISTQHKTFWPPDGRTDETLVEGKALAINSSMVKPAPVKQEPTKVWHEPRSRNLRPSRRGGRQFKAFNRFFGVSSGEILYQTFSRTPFSSIKNAERVMPM